MKNKSLLLSIFLMLLFACDPNDDNGGSSTTDEQFAENFGPSASRDFIGQVVDIDNHAIVGATVTIGTSSVQTDANGVFVINGANVREKFAYVKATKIGYLDGSRSMVPTSGKNSVKIMLIPATTVATVASGTPAEVELPSGTKVTFDGAFEDENGNAYSGNVGVAMFQLDASNENIAALMPGMLYAKGEDGQAKVLQTFGMLNVDLRGSGGQKLNIAEGHTAEISMKIDASQTATAPSSIPLWHFDEAVGYWKQDGVATKQGDVYIGEVSHFSWWNFDVPTPTVNLTLSITDQQGNPLTNIVTTITIISSGATTSTLMTDSAGQISGAIPAGEALHVVIYDACGGVALETNIGPFTEDTVLPAIALPPFSVPVTTVNGSLMTCDGSPVTNGYVILTAGNSTQVQSVTDGTFSIKTLICPGSSSFVLDGADFGSLQSTGPIQYNFTTPLTEVGSLFACNEIDQFIRYQIGDGPVQFYTPQNCTFSYYNQVNNFNTATEFNIQTLQPNQPGFQIAGSTYVPGSYPYSTGTFHVSGPFNANPFNPNTVTMQIINYGAIGEYVDMRFTGMFFDINSSQMKEIDCTVHVIRQN